MSSILKIQSARANGARSRGPVTPEGRARSSKNAAKHGLASAAIVLSSESQEEFDQLLEAYITQFNPQTVVEADLVEQLVAARWRMERVWRIETALLDLEIAEQQDAVDQKFERIDDVARTALAFRSLCDNSRALDLLSRYESQFRRAGERALDSLLRLQDQRLQNEKLQNEPNHTHTRGSDAEPRFENGELPAPPKHPSTPLSGDAQQLQNEKAQNEPNHTQTGAQHGDPEPPPDFTSANPSYLNLMVDCLP